MGADGICGVYSERTLGNGNRLLPGRNAGLRKWVTTEAESDKLVSRFLFSDVPSPPSFHDVEVMIRVNQKDAFPGQLQLEWPERISTGAGRHRTASLRSPCGHIWEAFSWLLTDVGGSRPLSPCLSPERRKKSSRVTSLHSSCPAPVCIPIPFLGYLKGYAETNPFFS